MRPRSSAVRNRRIEYRRRGDDLKFAVSNPEKINDRASAPYT
jgi:hypothetical protein